MKARGWAMLVNQTSTSLVRQPEQYARTPSSAGTAHTSGMRTPYVLWLERRNNQTQIVPPTKSQSVSTSTGLTRMEARCRWRRSRMSRTYDARPSLRRCCASTATPRGARAADIRRQGLMRDAIQRHAEHGFGTPWRRARCTSDGNRPRKSALPINRQRKMREYQNQ